MRALIWLLLLAALATAVALSGVSGDKGYVLWVWPPWRMEMSINFFLVTQLLLLVGSYLLLRLLANTLGLPRTVGELRSRWAMRRDARLAGDALRMLWEGRYSQALAAAEKVRAPAAGDAAAGSLRGAVALVAVKAANALRDEERLRSWRRRAVALDDGGWRTARLMEEMRIALDGGDFAAAATLLEQLGTRQRRSISALRLALRIARGQGEHSEVLRLVGLLEKHGALAADMARPLRLAAHRSMLEMLRDDPSDLMRHWRNIAAADRSDPNIASFAAQVLADIGACAESTQLIEDVLDDRWEPDLLEIYVACENRELLGSDVVARIERCERWLTQHPHDAALLLALGRLCGQKRLWGKAQSYFEASLAVQPGGRAHLELARLSEQMERSEEANRHYRAAALLLAQPKAAAAAPSTVVNRDDMADA